MLKINYMSTLFIGIDVISKTNAVYAMDFEENKYIPSSFANNHPGADNPVNQIATSSAVLAEFLSPKEIIDMLEKDLLSFLAQKSTRAYIS